MKNLIPTLICLFLVVPSQAGIIYVDANATGDMNGGNWANAYNYLQDALADANSDPNVDEIRVAQGTYTPDSSSGDPNGSGDREATFQLISGVALYGGFPSGSDPNFNDRDPNIYETVLSGDLDGNDVTGLDPCDFRGEPTRGENSYHVVTGSGTEPNAVLDGFTITAGNGNGSYPENSGGGIYNEVGSPTLINCTIRGNWGKYGGGIRNNSSSPLLADCTFTGNASGTGAGMYNSLYSSPTLTNCTFEGNFAKSLPGSTYGSGGGMYNSDNSNPTLTRCIFSNNIAEKGKGGGVYSSYSCNPTLTNCTIRGNLAGADGGGMYHDDDNIFYSSATLVNCTFSGNSAARDGGGMCISEDSHPTLVNCLFSGNRAANKGGGMYSIYYCSPTLINCTFVGNTAKLYGGGMDNVDYSNVVLINCIFWSNNASQGPQVTLRDNTILSINYCNIQSGQTGVYLDSSTLRWGDGNIDADPCFVDAGYWDNNDTPGDANDDFWVDGDYHLQSEGWRWDANSESWVTDANTSLCIDAGNPGCPLGDEPNDSNNIRINMGAYGGTAEASMPPYDWALLANLTNDGKVDSNDLAAFVNYWLDSGECIPSDLNRNQFVDFIDFALLGQDWFLETSWYTP